MDKLIEQIKKARFIWICGNGGSAATAEHFTTDLVKKGYRAICLNSNTPVITMLANDYEYEYIFSEQVRVYAAEEDLLVTISCSGRSANIVNAMQMAWVKNVSVYEFETFGKNRDYAKLENKHLQFAHEVAKRL